MAKTNRQAQSMNVPKSRKDDIVRMRVSDEQKKALTAAAARDGLELSTWLRQLALRAAGVLPEPK